jgi:hypothetical protein
VWAGLNVFHALPRRKNALPQTCEKRQMSALKTYLSYLMHLFCQLAVKRGVSEMVLFTLTYKKGRKGRAGRSNR